MRKIFKRSAALAALLFVATLSFAGCGDTPPETPDEGDKPGIEQPVDEYGTVSIEDVVVWINQNKDKTFAEIKPVFSKPEKAETLTYEYDAKSLSIADGIVTPLKRSDSTHEIKATSEHFSTTFEVEVVYIPLTGEDALDLYDVSRFNVGGMQTRCMQKVTEDMTVIIGDSFTDDYFIGEFMREFSKGKQVINAGINSTTTYHWEAAATTIIGDTAPKNIVLHIGTNNFYDVRDMVNYTEESLCRLFMFLHQKYPETNIYWFNITQRSDTRYSEQVTTTNKYMAQWCAQYDWVICVDTCSKIKTSMLKDGIHPKTEHYHVFTDALVEAGCKIAPQQ